MRLIILAGMVMVLLYSNADAASLLWSDNFDDGNIDGWLDPYATNSASTDYSYSGAYSKKSDRAIGTPTCTIDITGDGNDFPPSGAVFVRYMVFLPAPAKMNGKWMRFIQQLDLEENQIEVWGGTGTCPTANESVFCGVSYHRYDGAYDNPPGNIDYFGTCIADTVSSGEWHKVAILVDTRPAYGQQIIAVWIDQEDYTQESAYSWTSDMYLVNTLDTEYDLYPSILHLPTGYNSTDCNGNIPILYVDDVEVWDDIPGQHRGGGQFSGTGGLH